MRLRDHGVVIGIDPPGPFNAITDVAGVRVGHTTLISGDVDDQPGIGPVRTGVTVIEARTGSVRDNPVYAGTATLNGNGEFTGLEWIRESGMLTTPIGLTNTHSVGTVRDGLVEHEARQSTGRTYWSLPAVAETYDGFLNDINGMHVRTEHVHQALAVAASGPVAEGNVGGGTGMICHEFKGGIGTSSRVVQIGDERYTVGVLVQANYGRREDLRVDGLPVGEVLDIGRVPSPRRQDPASRASVGAGSIIFVVATDAPLLSDQCRRLAQRSYIGLARVGGGCADSSGDIALAFATGNDLPGEYLDGPAQPFPVRSLAHQVLNPLFRATADATEEAILNALLAAETMAGLGGAVAHGLDGALFAQALAQLRADR